MAEITTIKDESKSVNNDTFRIEKEYKADNITLDVVKEIVTGTEKDFLPHAHILCIAAGASSGEIYRKFRNIGEFKDGFNGEIFNNCSEYMLKRLNHSVSLTCDICAGYLYLSGEVPEWVVELPFSEYEYYKYV